MRGLLLVLLIAAAWAPASARTLVVGAGEVFASPGIAALAARPGDTVAIRPGRYGDCAVWNADNVTVEAMGEGVVLSGEICMGKAIFVVSANNVTIRGLTFSGAHNRVHNGAGIRAEGRGLTVENARFIDNDEGILAGSNPGSTIVIRGSTFEGNGNCIAACAHGIYIGTVARLTVEDCTFTAQREGHHIKSRALRTELIGNRIADGSSGTASYLVDLPNGGSALIARNRFEKGPRSQNHVGIAIAAEQDQPQNPPGDIEIRDNDFINDGAASGVFVRNFGTVPARLAGNRVTGAAALQGPGSAR